MNDTTLTYTTLPHAEGAIEPKTEQADRLDEITERLARGEFHVPVATNGTIPVICKDGRYGGFNLLPNAGGGTETLMVADDLTFKAYDTDGTTRSAYENVLARVAEKGLPVGGHTDENRTATTSGCGANDKLDVIYNFLSRKGEVIRETASALGVDVDDELHARMINHATERQQFSPGNELLESLAAYGDQAVIEPLVGTHKEVAAVINTRSGTTLDRRALQAEFGDGYQSFNVDVWSFEAAARTLTDDESKIQPLIAAMVYYNLAVAHVLGGPSLRILVLS